MWRWWAQLWAYVWPSPITAMAFIMVGIIRLSGGVCQKHGNAWEASNGAASRLLWLMNPWGNIHAITFGHVIIARDAEIAAALRVHEHTHVRQYERWGILFPILYFASSAIAMLRGGSAYRDNVFEREAFQVAAKAAAAQRQCPTATAPAQSTRRQ